MLIVDSQVHLWAPNTPERPWPKVEDPPPHRTVALGIDEMLGEMDSAGVHRVIIVPPSWEGGRNDLALAAAKAYPDRFAVMARLDPAAPSSRGSMIDLRRQPGMLGLRFAFRASAALRQLTEGHADWIWGEAEKAGIPVSILVRHDLVHLIDEIAQRYPNLRIALDHLGLTGTKKDEEAFRNFDKLLPIAKRPNVAAKVSALPCFSNDAYPYRSLHGYIRKAYDAFGPKRLFWGTDFSRSPISYRQNVTMFTEEIPWLTNEDKDLIMGRGVCEWLGWNVPEAR